MRPVTGLAIVCAWLCACVLPASLAAPPKNAPFVPGSNDAIQVPQCRVKLLDDVQLASERTGIIESVATEGDVVRAGQIVVKLRDRLLQAGRAITEREATNDIEVRFARKASELAQLKYLRAVEANRTVAETVSELELRELRLAAEKSLLQLEQAEHQFLIAGLKRDEADELLRTCRVQAPFDCVVLDVLKKPGEVVREGDPILRMATSGRMRVEGFLPVNLVHRVRRGQPVQVRLDPIGSEPAPNALLTGRLAFVDMKVEPVSQKIRVWAEVANQGDVLRDGLTATLSILPADTSSKP